MSSGRTVTLILASGLLTDCATETTPDGFYEAAREVRRNPANAFTECVHEGFGDLDRFELPPPPTADYWIVLPAPP